MTLTAVLFAGGLSSRMGTDKAQVEVFGQPLWARQLNLLQSLKPETVWVSARARPSWCPTNIEAVLDDHPSRGPLSGLVPALARIKTSHLLALAIDLPCITQTMLERLWRTAEVGRGVVRVNQGRFEPLCAIYPRESAAIAAEALNRGELSLQQLILRLEQQNLLRRFPITAIDEEAFLNLNTSADLNRLEQA